MSQALPPPPPEPTTPEATTCARCRRPVGLLWFQGHSTLVDSAVKTDGSGRTVVTRHQCPTDPTKQGPYLIDPQNRGAYGRSNDRGANGGTRRRG